jgi:hypothetical protein
VPTALGRLKTLWPRGLAATASLGPDVRVASGWGQRGAPMLSNAARYAQAAVLRRLQGRRGAMGPPPAQARRLAPAVGHFVQVSRRAWPGLLHCESLPDLPRTKNDLEQFVGAHRSQERRATGRKGAAPGWVRRGSVRLVAGAATRIRPFASEDLVPETVRAWQELRHNLETRRQQRTQRRHFRRDPASYLAKREADLLKLILPP